MAETSSDKYGQEQFLTELCENFGPEVLEEIVNNYAVNQTQSVKIDPTTSLSYGAQDNFLAYDMRDLYTGDYYSNHYSTVSPEGTTSYLPSFYNEPNQVLSNQYCQQPQGLFQQQQQSNPAFRNYVGGYPTTSDQSAYSRQAPLSSIQPIQETTSISTGTPTISYCPPPKSIADFQKSVKIEQLTARDNVSQMRIIRKAIRPSSKYLRTNNQSPKMAAISTGDFTSFHSPLTTTTTSSSTLSLGNDSLNDSGFSSDVSSLSPMTKHVKFQSNLISSTVRPDPITPSPNKKVTLPTKPFSSGIYIKPKMITKPITSQTTADLATAQAYSMNRIQLVKEPITPPTAVINPRMQIPTSASLENYDPSEEIMRLLSKKRPAKDYGCGASRSKKLRHNEPLNNSAVDIMAEWYESHSANPYPTKAEKDAMALSGNISLAQVKSWFANKRNRNNNTRPKVQKKQMEAKLINICHQLASDSKRPVNTNSHIIHQLSSLLEQARANSH